MPELPDRLKDYITVAERIEAFYAKFPDGSLQSRIVELTQEHVVIEASAYRDRDDSKPGIGYSSMPIPAKNVMLRDSEIETCETSAWGRAIAALGFDVRKAVASRNEIEAKTPTHVPPVAAGADGSLIGVVEAGDKTTSDYQVRMDPEGVPHLGFRLRGDKGGILVEASGDLAEDLAIVRDVLVGQRVSAWGTVEDRSFVSGPAGKKRTVTYQALALTRLTGPDGISLPVAREVSTAELFPEDEVELDAAIASV